MADTGVIRPHIGGGSHPRGTDAVIAALAERQHGAVARRQLLELGIGRRAIERRIERGQLHLIHLGVYAVGHRVLSRHGRWMAAVLACGDGAVLSHRSAAALWGIRPAGRTAIDVTVRRALRPRPGLRPHRSTLPEDEVTTRMGIPVTTPERTLLDLAAVLDRAALDRTLNEAEVLRLPGPAAMLERHPRRKGALILRALLAGGRANPTKSELENRLLVLAEQYALPRPETNVVIEGYEVDAVWRQARLIVELDGFATHGTRQAFERDRARDRRLTLAGWRPLRVTGRQLDDRASLAEELRQLLAPRS